MSSRQNDVEKDFPKHQYADMISCSGDNIWVTLILRQLHYHLDYKLSGSGILHFLRWGRELLVLKLPFLSCFRLLRMLSVIVLSNDLSSRHDHVYGKSNDSRCPPKRSRCCSPPPTSDVEKQGHLSSSDEHQEKQSAFKHLGILDRFLAI